MRKQLTIGATLLCFMVYWTGCATKPKFTLADGAYYLITNEPSSVRPGVVHRSVTTVTVLKKSDNEVEVTWGGQLAVGRLEDNKFTLRAKDGGSFYVLEGEFVGNNHIMGKMTRGALNEVGDVSSDLSFDLTQEEARIPKDAGKY